MGLIDMFSKIIAFPLERRLICTANVASIVSFILDFFLHVSLLGELINDDGCYYVGQENLEKTPVDQVRNELVLVSILVYTFADDFLCIKRFDAGCNWVTVIVDSVDVNVYFLVFIKRYNVVIDCQEPEDKRKNHS